MKIVFMGTPEFAVPSLDILINAGHEIVAVITSPDKWGGRGRKTLIESAVKKYASAKNLKIMQPTNLKNESFLEELKSLNADVQVVVAFRMLPRQVWEMPPLGTWNLHGSLLPQYRGAAPINWAIIKGEKTSGVTFFKLKHEIDTGSLLLQKEIQIQQEDSATDLHNKMMYIAADVVLESVDMIGNGQVELKEQNPELVSHAPKLTPENTQIDFNNTALDVYNFIRGLSLYPGAWFKLNDKMVKIYKASLSEDQRNDLEHGQLATDNKNYLQIKCKDRMINVLEIKYPGKRMMSIDDFLNGFDLESELNG